MNHRTTILLGALALTFAAGLPAQTKKAYVAPRTSDGKPDLQGIWTNVTLTPLERPAFANGKATLTDADAAAFEKSAADMISKYDGKAENPFADAAGSGGTGGYNALFVDRGTELARVNGMKRSSLVAEPADGKVPPTTPEARQRNAAVMRSYSKFDRAADRPLGERCILGFGSTSGPPMLPVMYNNNYQIVQTPTHVVILVEMVHDARIVRIGGTHPPADVRQWLGDSIGHWEGDTLVVETMNFTDKTRFRGSSENLRVTERFTRVDAETILYKATMDDPSTFTKPWTVEYPFRATAGPIYEYACHEGNYSLFDILGGARKAEAEKEGK